MAINTSKVLVGGIVGGIVANVIDFIRNSLILGEMHQADMAKLNPALDAPPSGGQIAGFAIFDIAWIIATVWIYAAIRRDSARDRRPPCTPRSSSWVVGTSVAGFFWALHIFGTHLFVATAGVELVNAIVSTLVGAWLCTEERRDVERRIVAATIQTAIANPMATLVAAAVTRPRNAPHATRAAAPSPLPPLHSARTRPQTRRRTRR